MTKSIENSIDFAAKRQVWQRMIFEIIRSMLIAMRIWHSSRSAVLSSKAARRKRLLAFRHQIVMIKTSFKAFL